MLIFCHKQCIFILSSSGPANIQTHGESNLPPSSDGAMWGILMLWWKCWLFCFAVKCIAMSFWSSLCSKSTRWNKKFYLCQRNSNPTEIWAQLRNVLFFNWQFLFSFYFGDMLCLMISLFPRVHLLLKWKLKRQSENWWVLPFYNTTGILWCYCTLSIIFELNCFLLV